MYLTDRPAGEERGAVLILIALLAVVLFLFVALAIDLTRIGSAHQKQGRTAELAALAALEAFMAEDPMTGSAAMDYKLKLQAAATRAEQIAGSQQNILQGGGQTVSQMGPSLSWKLRETTGILPEPPADDVVGEMTPGRWWFGEPPGSTAGGGGTRQCPPALPSTDDCPCGQGNVVTAPCFQPNSAADTTATAFEIRINSHEDNPIRTVFARAVGARETFAIENVAQAALVPRQAVFAIDFSNSIASETHHAPESIDDFCPLPSIRPLGQVAFQTTDAASCTGAWSAPGNVPPTGTSIMPFLSRFAWEGHPSYPNPPPATPCVQQPAMPITRPTAPTVPRFDQHYQSDYECRAIDYDLDGTDDAYYLVETASIGETVCFDPPACTNTGPYRGPEPLSTVLTGINEALDIMETLSVPGDQIIVIGFDDQLIEARFLGPTAARSGEPDFDLLRKITDVTNPAYVDTRLNRVFFPRNPGFTDIPEVLVRSLQELTQLPGAEAADSWIALFTDGLSTCSHFDGAISSNSNFLTYSSGPPATVDFVMPNKSCYADDLTPSDPALPDYSSPPYSNTFEWAAEVNEILHQKSMAEARTLAGDGPLTLPDEFRTLAESGVGVHTFLFGDYVQPHTMVRKGQNGCMSDAEARGNDAGYTTSGDTSQEPNINNYRTISAESPYLPVNVDLHEGLSKPTQGIFTPVRPPCDPALFPSVADADDCRDNGGIVEALNTQCNALGSVGDVLDPNEAAALPPGIDAIVHYGRLICDPRCRTPQEQVIDSIRQLFDVNPFVLVEKP